MYSNVSEHPTGVTVITAANIGPSDPHTYGLLSDTEIKVLSYIFLITSLLSLAGSGSIIFATVKMKKVCKENVLPLFHLCLSDFLGGVVLLIGTTYHVSSSSQFHRTGCLIITMVATSLYMSTFLFTVNYAWQVYRQVIRRISLTNSYVTRTRNRSTSYLSFKISTNALIAFLAWILPFTVSMIVMFSDSGYDENGSFILNDDMCSCCFPLFVYESANCQQYQNLDPSGFNWYNQYKIVFILLLVVCCVAIAILYGMTYYKFKQILLLNGIVGRPQYDMLDKMKKRSGFLSAIFVGSWISTLILGFFSFKYHFRMNDFYFLFVAQACTSPLQGFLNSIIYGWNRKSFRKVLTEVTPLLDPVTEISVSETENDLANTM